jgi:hypothetical protein
MNNSLTMLDVAGIPLTPIPSPRSTEARGERPMCLCVFPGIRGISQLP